MNVPERSIAIIGMSGRFPGADSIPALWHSLLAGAETISNIHGAAPAGPGVHVPRRGLLNKPEWFVAAFFGITPREAEVLDPQQRVFLEESWTALENAACDPARYEGAIGVYAGMSNNTYWRENVAHHPELIESVGALTAMMANEKDYLATRVAYKLNLRGPALNIYTACSTSLVAVCQAVQALLDFHCDIALAGGVSITFPHERGYYYEESGILSPDGHCRAFDVKAAGTVFSNGAGVVVLKRLEDALADGDTIHAVIRAAALNNDGSDKVSFTAPSVDGHAGVIALAQAFAEIPPRTIGYIEAHGTGTPLGDPIEIAGLTQAFRADTSDTGFCAIGSLKTNIGHLDAAAGIAGLIKAVLCVREGKIPPSLHFTTPNPALDLPASPFFIADRLLDWPVNDAPRRAGVSSFGVGGTNAHCIIEQAPTIPRPHATPPGRPLILPLSAKTSTALAQAAANLADHIETHPELDLSSIAHTLQIGRAEMSCRSAVVAHSRELAISALRGFESRRTFSGTPGTGGVVLMLPGQGAQYAGMARELHTHETAFRDALDECCELLQPQIGLDLRTLLHPTQEAESMAHERLRETRFTQPAIFSVSYALARLWMSWGIEPAALIGHSVGEYAAAALAGVFTLPDALRLVAKRAQFVDAQPPGAMLAVRLSEDELRPFLSADVALAAANAPKLSVLAGPDAAIAELESRLTAEGIAAKRLATSHAFHSPMMDPVIEPLAALAASIPRNAPAIPIMSTVSASWLSMEDATDPRYWARHARETVRFAPAMAALIEAGHRTFIECGPGTTLTQLARQQRAADALIVSSIQDGEDDMLTMRSAAASLWTRGVRIGWSAMQAGPAHRVPLPTYPFERKRHFAEPPAQQPAKAATLASSRDSQDSSPLETIHDAPAITPQHPRVREVLAVLESLSGTAFSDTDAALTYVELGFDSLFLTQAAIALFKRFGVKITLRQLLTDFPTPATLAAHLDLVRTTKDTATPPPAAPRPAPPQAAPAPRAHGPFRAIDRTDAGLSAKQRAHLDTLIARYTARTAASKDYTATHRPHFADPRSVAGFRREWKEIVYPLVCTRSEGAHLWDADGCRYVDVTLGFGQILFGHRPAWLVAALEKQLHTGIEIGPTHPLAGELAARLSRFLEMERVAFCNTGSEAVAAALRIARTVTARDTIVVFGGAYHGIFDEVLFRPGPAPIAPGIPQSAVQNLVVLDYGSDSALEWLRAHAGSVAAVLVEPVQSRHPGLAPREFLHSVRAITRDAGAALIFDEIVTGFRFAPRGAQEFFDVRADIATYGKIIGGGIPVGIIAGSAQFMDALDGGPWHFGDDSMPEAGVTFFAGTFVRHPLALAAASAVLAELSATGPQLQAALADKAASLTTRMNATLDRHGVPLRWEQCSSLYHLPLPPDLRFAPLIFHHMRLRGIHIWENRPCFLSAAHSTDDIEAIARAFDESIEALLGAEMLPARHADGIADTPGDAAVFPLTSAQHEIHLATRLGPDASAAFHDAITLRLRGTPDIPALRTALAALVSRHESLRTTFAPDGSSQTVHPSMPAHLEEMDPPGDSAEPEALIERFTLAPFDLASGPLFRAALLRVKPHEHLLVFCAHHIVCDGWSFGLVAHELAALTTGTPIEPAMTIRDWQRATNPAQQSAAGAWWLDQFREVPQPLDLPADRPRPAQRTFLAATVTHDLPAELCNRLRHAAATGKVTLFALLLGAFHALLARLSGQPDVVVGIASAAQAELERPLLGHCVNFLPIRAVVTAEQPFIELAASLGARVMEAREHQQVGFGRLLQMLPLPREQGRMPLTAVSFNVDRAPGALTIAGAAAEFLPAHKLRHHLELSFNLIEHNGGHRVFCNFNRDLFDAATIARWLDHYATLLTGIAAAPATPCGSLPLLTESEVRQILVEWNATGRGYPRDSGVDGLFEQIAAEQPGAPAVRDGNATLSYAELNSRANMLAHRLIAAGVAPGACVGLCLPRSAGLIAAMLATLKAGCAYVPLDPDWPPERLHFMARDGALATVITRLDHARSFAGSVLLLDGPHPLLPPPDDNPAIPTHGSSAAYVMYTSGSTGAPKGVVVPHRAITRLVCNTDYAQLTANDATGFASNPAFDAATFEVWGALLNGGKVVVMDKQTLLDPSSLRRAIHENGITAMFMTTALFNQFAAIAPDIFGSLRHLLTGGDAANPGSFRAILDAAPPARLVHVYGPTETTTFATAQIITRVAADAVTLPIGRPIANTTAYILDERMHPVPVGVTGELFLGGDGLALGYFNRPELTAERFVAHPFQPSSQLYRTGDLARWLLDGTIDFIGRRDSQVKLRGFRIEPGEIEHALASHPGVRECAVIARISSAGEKSLAAYFVPHPGAENTAMDLSAHLRRTLPDYMIPAAFVRMDALPLTANGKLDRRALPEPASANTRDEAPANPMETRVAGLMAEALGIASVSVRDDFFRLGGHSLLAMDLLARLRREFNVEVPPAQLFAGPNAIALAAAVSALLPGAPSAPQGAEFEFIVPIQRGDPAKRPLFLMAGGWGGEIEFLVYGPIAQQIGESQPIYGLKARGAGTGAAPHQSVTEMAADYIREIRAIQPSGPYWIAGECVGGICAHEIACQLREAGQRVEKLILLDTSVPNPDELADYLAGQESRADAAEFRPTLTGRIRHHREQMKGMSLAERARYLLRKAARKTAPSTPPAQHPRGQAQYPPTLMRHALRAYPGRVTLLVDEESSRLYGTLGWDRARIGALDIHVLPGNHISYIRDHSASAARKLHEILETKPDAQ